MLNFREELEEIKRVSTDMYTYEAEKFLQSAITRLKKEKIEFLKKASTFDVEYILSKQSDKFCFICAGFNNTINFSKSYDVTTGKKVFEEIEETLEKTCSDIIKKEPDHIHVYFNSVSSY